MIFTSSDKIPVGIGVGHSSALGLTVESMVGSAVCSVVCFVLLVQTLRSLKCEDKNSKVIWFLKIEFKQ